MNWLLNETETLTKSQEETYKVLLSGKNVFINGNAGTGKSFIIQKYIKNMRQLGKKVVVTAPSGIAALNIGGYTIHRSFKVPVELSKLTKDDKRIKPNKVMENADIVIIDEISMVSYELFRYISLQFFKSKNIRNKQMIVIGDFFQLPPVLKAADKAVLSKRFLDYKGGFAFNSPFWSDYNFQICTLNEIVRQSDEEYINKLNNIRVGNELSLPYFNNRVNSHNNNISNKIVRLFPTNAQVDNYNNSQLDLLTTPKEIFTTTVHEYIGKVGEGDYSAPKELHLKVGARIMTLINDKEKRYSNGSFGTVINIDIYKEIITVELDTGKLVDISKFIWEIKKPKVKEVYNIDGKLETIIEDQLIAEIIQYPLKLAYAVTIHKSQGQTFDQVVIDPSCFAYGQLYVALSRCTNVNGLYLLKEIDKNSLIVSQDVVDFYTKNGILKDGIVGELTEEYIKIEVPKKYEKRIRDYLDLLMKQEVINDN